MTWTKLKKSVYKINKLLNCNPQKKIFNYTYRNKKVPINFLEWGNASKSTVICLGGIANVAIRFSFLAKELQSDYHIVAMDWAGRGDSGWLEEIEDYTNKQALDQLSQLMIFLNKESVHIIGSSYGGTIAIDFASIFPKKVKSIVLNDIGPEMSAARRKRRSMVLAKHYVFKDFLELERKLGASQKNDGIADKNILLFNAYHLTKWSDIEQGRVYKHDHRAMLAYKKYSKNKLDQWDAWDRVKNPIHLIRGELSDALTNKTISKMLSNDNLSIFKVPYAGHTPSLVSEDQVKSIKDFLMRIDK
jgi:pimeloyl-ACP methyl ester carboxylesterase